MSFHDLRSFLSRLETAGQMRWISPTGMMGIWSCQRPFTCTRFIITDEVIDVRDWSQVIRPPSPRAGHA